MPDSSGIDPTKNPPHLVTPEGAVHVDKAEGQFGDKVAIAGFSVSNFGIFASSDKDIGLVAKGGKLAAQFNGDVEVTGDCVHHGNIDCHGDMNFVNADCAEQFDIVEGLSIEPGTVMVLDNDGTVCPSRSAYDQRVAGVVSGAGDYRPALTLDTRQTSRERLPVALMGKVYCRVDATQTPIQVGDLLTTSPTEGHAMKASDPLKAFGAVIGKALQAFSDGQGIIPILVTLQ